MFLWRAVYVVFLTAVPCFSPVFAQGGSMTVPGVAPSPLIRLTGVLKAVEEPRVSAFPVLRVWVAGKRWRFRIAHVEAIISAYPAQEKLRRISSLGLRLLAEDNQLALLQSATMHDRLIVIEGWLRVKASVMHVRSVHVVSEPPD